MDRQFHLRDDQNYAGEFRNPDANPLYDREYSSDFMEALEEGITRKKEVGDTHVVFISHPSGTPRVAEIGSADYYRLIRNHTPYVTGDKQLCDETAKDLWETISDGTEQ